MYRHLLTSLVLFTGHLFGQKILKFKVSDLAGHNIDTLVVSSSFFGHKNQTFQLKSITNEFLLINYNADTLNLEPKPYSLLQITGFKNLATDTINITFLQLSKFNFADTIIFSTTKRSLFSKNYKTTRQDTIINSTNSDNIKPSKTTELSINNKNYILALSSLDTIGSTLACGRRTTNSKQTRTHRVFYTLNLK